MLVDAGADGKVLGCLSKHMPIGDVTLEIAVVTHADIDHFKGFNSVFNTYLVGEVWLVSLDKDTTDFTQFKQLLARKLDVGTRLRMLNQGDVFSFKDIVTISVLWPKISAEDSAETILSDANLVLNSKKKWENDLSIVLKVQIFDQVVLLTGDIESGAEQALLAADLISDVEVLKVAHHGSKTSTTDLFLERTQPEIAAVSSGVNNQHGHPTEEIIAKITDVGAIILRTDQLSTFGLLFERGKGIEILKN